MTWRSPDSSPDDHHRLVGLDGERVVVVEGPVVGGGVEHELLQVDRAAVEGALLVEAGEEQQVLDEAPHAGGLALDAAHGPRQRLVARRARPCGRARRSPGWR